MRNRIRNILQESLFDDRVKLRRDAIKVGKVVDRKLPLSGQSQHSQVDRNFCMAQAIVAESEFKKMGYNARVPDCDGHWFVVIDDTWIVDFFKWDFDDERSEAHSLSSGDQFDPIPNIYHKNDPSIQGEIVFDYWWDQEPEIYQNLKNELGV